MIHQFASFIQFMAAIYFAMAFEGVILKKIITPDFSLLVMNKIRQAELPMFDACEQILTESVDKFVNKITIQAQNKGLFLFVFCLILLIYFGYTAVDVSKISNFQIQYLNIPVFIIIVYILIRTLLCFLLSIKLTRTLDTLIISLLFMILNHCWPCFKNVKYEKVEILLNITPTLIVATLTVPLLWHLFINYVYASRYPNLIFEVIRKEKQDLYTLSEVRNASEKAPNISEINNIQEKYREALQKIGMVNNIGNDAAAAIIENEFISIIIRHIENQNLKTLILKPGWCYVCSKFNISSSRISITISNN